MTPQSANQGYDEPEPQFGADSPGDVDGPTKSEPPRPVNWNILTAAEAEFEWIELNKWVNWLRRTYGLAASVVPPLWHRHPELVWELSAVHLHWLSAYDPDSMDLRHSDGTTTSPTPASAFTTGSRPPERALTETAPRAKPYGRVSTP